MLLSEPEGAPLNVSKCSFSLWCLICCIEIFFLPVYIQLIGLFPLTLLFCLMHVFFKDGQICRRNSSSFLGIMFSRRSWSKCVGGKVWHVFRKKSIRSEDWPVRTMAMFFVKIPNPCVTLCCSLASPDAAPESHWHRKRRAFMCSVLDTFSMWSSVSSGSWAVCFQLLCYLTFLLFLSSIPLVLC